MTLDDRRLRWLLAAALVVLALGLWFFVLRGADQPEDPFLADPPGATTPTSPLGTTPAGATPPGDPARVRAAGFDEVAIAVEPPGGGTSLLWCLLAAIAPDQRARGLMGVTDLQGYDGMAFLYDEDWQNSFHMKDTPMPLSIAWIAEDGAVVSTADMDPCLDEEPCPAYPPGGIYRTAIEVPQGRLDDLGIVPGARVHRAGACAAAAGSPAG